jgi:multiple sugar transport system substrate-binding protein
VIELRGMTWDHPRGIDPLRACADELEGVRIRWDARSLEDFEAYPLDDLAQRYDLMVIDHPHVGMAAVSGCLAPFPPDMVAPLLGKTIGRSQETYEYDRRTWALAIDAAAQVAARSADAGDPWPGCFEAVLALARQGQVLWPLAPVHALMSFMTWCANAGAPCGQSGSFCQDTETCGFVLESMRRLAAAAPGECFTCNPIAVLDRIAAEPERRWYAPLIYGYVTYARTRRVAFGDIPSLKRGGDCAGSVLGGTGIAVSAYCKHARVAQQAAARIASADVQAGIFATSGGQPAHLAAWTNADVDRAAAGFFSGTRQTLERSFVRPRFDGYIGFQQHAGELIAACLRGHAGIDQTLTALCQSFDRARAGRRKDPR